MDVQRLASKHMPRIMSLADLVMFSGSNLLLTLTISRVFGPSSLAIFGVGLSIGLIAQSIGRGIYVVPSAVLGGRHARRRMSGLIAEHLICLYSVCAAGIVFLILSWLIAPTGSSLSLALCFLYCVLLYMQADHDRFMLLRLNRHIAPPALSAANLLPLGIGLLTEHFLSAGFAVFMALHVIYGFSRSVVVMRLAGGVNFRWGWRFLKDNLRQRGFFSVISAAAYAGYNHFPLVILAAIGQPIQAAAFVAMRGLVQPTQMIFRSFDFRDKLTMRDRSGGSYKGLALLLNRIAVRNIALSVLAAIGCLILGPFVSHLAYGSDYNGYSLLMVGHAAIFTLMSLMLPIDSGINILRWHNRTISWRISGGIIGTALAYPLTMWLGAWGAVLACIFGWLVVVAGGVVVLKSVLLGSVDGRFQSAAKGIT